MIINSKNINKKRQFLSKTPVFVKDS